MNQALPLTSVQCALSCHCPVPCCSLYCGISCEQRLKWSPNAGLWRSPSLLLAWRVEENAAVGSLLALGVKLIGLLPCCLGLSSLSSFVWGMFGTIWRCSEITSRVDDCCPSLFTGTLLFSKRHVSVGISNLGRDFLQNFIMELHNFISAVM